MKKLVDGSQNSLFGTRLNPLTNEQMQYILQYLTYRNINSGYAERFNNNNVYVGKN
jgi:hypothetical protein